ncbi:hypothetical protein D3C75_784030 [compost metagenome]
MRYTDPHIPFRKNNPVHAQLRQRTPVQDRDRLRDYLLDTQLFQQNRRQNAPFHIVPDGDNAAVEIAHAQGTHDPLIRSIRHHRVGQLPAHFLHPLFHVVDSEHFIAHSHQLKRQT